MHLYKHLAERKYGSKVGWSVEKTKVKSVLLFTPYTVSKVQVQLSELLWQKY